MSFLSNVSPARFLLIIPISAAACRKDPSLPPVLLECQVKGILRREYKLDALGSAKTKIGDRLRMRIQEELDKHLSSDDPPSSDAPTSSDNERRPVKKRRVSADRRLAALLSDKKENGLPDEAESRM